MTNHVIHCSEFNAKTFNSFETLMQLLFSYAAHPNNKSNRKTHQKCMLISFIQKMFTFAHLNENSYNVMFSIKNFIRLECRLRSGAKYRCAVIILNSVEANQHSTQTDTHTHFAASFFLAPPLSHRKCSDDFLASRQELQANCLEFLSCITEFINICKMGHNLKSFLK